MLRVPPAPLPASEFPVIDDPTDPYGGYPPPPAEPGDPTQPNGWWEVVDGVWRWITMPLPGTIAR